MGHLVGKDLYRELGAKIDGLTLRVPYNATLREILCELYSETEAQLVVAMPYSLSTLGRLKRSVNMDAAGLEKNLENLCDKGLVIDVELGGTMRYMPSPFAIGVFEFTMMRQDTDVDSLKMARLFSEYFDSGEVWRANLSRGQQMMLLRTLPHEGTVVPDQHVEVLDYDKASFIVESHDKHAMGLCSCRHEKDHLGDNTCAAPRGNCMQMGTSADFMIRRGLAQEVSKQQMLDELQRSRDLGLVLNADNVQKGASYICNCCSCCCNLLLGIHRHGYAHTVVTSRFLAGADEATCDGCGRCKKACPIKAISLRKLAEPRGKKRFQAEVDEALCIGCGVCVLSCQPRAMQLHARAQRVMTPETTFERVILQALEAGTLQNQLFDDPGRISHSFLRGFVGGFLRLSPVKKALLSDSLRSRFLSALKTGASRSGQSAAVDF